MPAEPRTIVVQGDGTNSLSFEIPGGVELDVQAVLVNVDASAAADTTAELKILEQSGVVIAAKRQSDVIPAGGSGSATWALRLDDGAGGTSTTGFLHWGVNTDTTNLGLTLTGNGAFAFTTGGNNFSTGLSGGTYSVSTSGGGVSFDLTGGGGIGGQFHVSTQGAGTIWLNASNNDFLLQNNAVSVASNIGELDLTSVNFVQTVSGSGTVNVIHDYTITLSAGGFSGGTYTVQADAGIVESIHKSGSKYIVKDHSGNSILELTG